jgi:hypothetical protein
VAPGRLLGRSSTEHANGAGHVLAMTGRLTRRRAARWRRVDKARPALLAWHFADRHRPVDWRHPSGPEGRALLQSEIESALTADEGTALEGATPLRRFSKARDQKDSVPTMLANPMSFGRVAIPRSERSPLDKAREHRQLVRKVAKSEP